MLAKRCDLTLNYGSSCGISEEIISDLLVVREVHAAHTLSPNEITPVGLETKLETEGERELYIYCHRPNKERGMTSRMHSTLHASL